MKSKFSTNNFFHSRSWLTLASLMLLVLFSFYLKNSFAQDSGADFDHDETGFPLDFKHATIKCESCHVQAVFAGTPRNCVECHNDAGRIKASSRSGRHIPITGDCDYCHQTNSWTNVAQVDHFAVSENCQACHNGVTAPGKNPGHIQSGQVCDDCHRTFTWAGATFDHSSVSANCSSCHNSVIATGKNPGHILTTNTCEDCHSTFGWAPVIRVDHAAVLGSCIACHNGITAQGKNAQHFVTSNECDLCHNTLGWLPAGFVHQSMAYPGDHRQNLDCTDCHVGSSSAVAWRAPAYQPDCAGCHAADFKPGPHKKYENPDTPYNISELRDCSGACHVYTDSSLNTISKTRNSQHRVSDGGF